MEYDRTKKIKADIALARLYGAFRDKGDGSPVPTPTTVPTCLPAWLGVNTGTRMSRFMHSRLPYGAPDPAATLSHGAASPSSHPTQKHPRPIALRRIRIRSIKTTFGGLSEESQNILCSSVVKKVPVSPSKKEKKLQAVEESHTDPMDKSASPPSVQHAPCTKGGHKVSLHYFDFSAVEQLAIGRGSSPLGQGNGLNKSMVQPRPRQTTLPPTGQSSRKALRPPMPLRKKMEK